VDMVCLADVSKWFWSDWFWLPAGITFGELKDQPGIQIARASDLYLMPILAIGILCLRYMFDICMSKVAQNMGIVDQRKRPEPNEVMETMYKICKRPSAEDTTALSKRLDWSNKKILTWFRLRRNLDRPSLVCKFKESSWRTLFYISAFVYGLYTLIPSPWFWDTVQCWVDYPKQNLWTTVYYYYMLEGGFYISLLFSIMSDVKRKDFPEQLIHHAATILLIMFSYVANFVRIGTMVMVIHDISDIFLEISKTLFYAGKQKIADVGFVVFSVVFIITRILIYPYYILHTTLVKVYWVLEPFPGYYLFNALLVILQLLHVFWAVIIVKMAIRMIRVGTVEKDARSDVEESDEDEQE
uniref:TLC domain-containing protein n=1 Tax=Ciona intestinalis TaxID=7719 RepID=F6S925_CIOIN